MEYRGETMRRDQRSAAHQLRRPDRFGRSPIAGRIAVSALAVFVALLVLDGVRLGNLDTGDTESIALGTRYAIDCMADGRFFECGILPGRVTLVYPYPLLQYLPATPMVLAGLDDQSVIQGLAIINLGAFFGTIGCALVLGRRLLAGWTPILLVVLLSSPLLYYATAGFGEMLAAFLALLFVTFTILGRPWPAGITLVVACLGKESFAPFLVGLGLLCALSSAERRPEKRRLVAAILAGGSVGVAITAAFNLFRFGSPLNLLYFHPTYKVPGRWVLSSFGALWAAPNGGLLWFWTSAMGLFGLILLVALRQRGAGGRAVRAWLPTLAVLVLFVGFQVGLAFWPYPFGWIAWGPRLTVALVPAFLVVAIHTGGVPLKATMDRCARSRWVVAGVGVVAVGTSFAQSGAVWNYRQATAALIEPTSSCPSLLRLPNPPAEDFYRCLHQVMWRLEPSFLLGSIRPDRLAATVGQLALAVAVGALVLAWRDGGRRHHSPTAGLGLERPSQPSETSGRAEQGLAGEGPPASLQAPK